MSKSEYHVIILNYRPLNHVNIRIYVPNSVEYTEIVYILVLYVADMSDQKSPVESQKIDGDRRGRVSRRSVLATGGMAASATLVGCLGGGSEDGTEGELEPPWTTEDLAEQIDDDATLTIYASTGSDQQWYDLVDVVNDEFGTSIKADVFASVGSEMTQRFVQERQANNDTADILSSPSDIDDEMKITAQKEGREAGLDVGRQYFEWDLDQKFWFNDELQDVQQYPFYIAAYNGGPGLTMPINENIFEDRGLDIPETYNDLFDGQYEGLKTLLSSRYIAPDMVGWVVRHHADQMDMDNLAWANDLREHLNYTGASSTTTAVREVRDGNAPLMFYCWPTVLDPFMGDDTPLGAVFPDNVKAFMNGSPIAINKEAPNPWVARFFLSAVLEEPVQRRMINDVTNQIPCRFDLDYSDQNPDAYTEKRLTADFEPVSFWDGWQNSEVGQTLLDDGAFEL